MDGIYHLSVLPVPVMIKIWPTLAFFCFFWNGSFANVTEPGDNVNTHKNKTRCFEMSKYNWKLFFFAQLILFVALQPKSWTSVSIRFIKKLSQASSLTEEVRYELTCGRIELAADSCRANSAESMWQAFVYLYWDWKGVGTQNCLQIRTHIICIHISSSHRYFISHIHTYYVVLLLVGSFWWSLKVRVALPQCHPGPCWHWTTKQQVQESASCSARTGSANMTQTLKYHEIMSYHHVITLRYPGQ